MANIFFDLKITSKKRKKEYSVGYALLAGFFWLLTITWILVIYEMSAENGTNSTETSQMVLNYLNNKLDTNVTSDSSLRVAAHISEFAILTILSYFALDFTNRISLATSYAESPIKIIKSDNEVCIIMTLWFTLLNALVDEYHQLFVAGRDGDIKDVLIDAIGVVVVLAVIRLIFSIYLRIRGKQEIRYE